MKGLSQNRSVVAVDLQDNKLGHNHIKGTQAVADMLAVNPCVTRLNLANNQIDEMGAMSLYQVLKDDQAILRRRGAPILDKLRRNETLTDLNLFHNDLGAASVMPLSDIIKMNSFLKVLNLESNRIGAVSGELIVDAMTENKTLTDFRVKFNQFTHQMEERIAGMVRANGGRDSKTTESLSEVALQPFASRALMKRSAILATRSVDVES